MAVHKSIAITVWLLKVELELCAPSYPILNFILNKLLFKCKKAMTGFDAIKANILTENLYSLTW